MSGRPGEVAERITLRASLLFAATLLLGSVLSKAQSFYPTKLNDSSAISVQIGKDGVHGNGIEDDTDALQHAIDLVEQTTGQGIVLLPDGHYRLTHTLYLWPGVRLIGYGTRRPVLLLADKTQGYGRDIAYMVFFTGGRPEQSGRTPRSGHSEGRTSDNSVPFPGTVPASSEVIDANPGTFYSAMSNIDFDMGDGNGGAVAIRMHAAQHCFLTHMDFRIRSGIAALHDIGNEAEDLHFHGGQYGILTSKPSPGWQFTLLDSTFDHQRQAAIREHEAGLTLVRDSFRDVPTAISIDASYAEELWIEDARFEQITGPAITISNEGNPRTEINALRVLCREVPIFARLRQSGADVAAPSATYRVDSFSHGLYIDHVGSAGVIRTDFDAKRLEQLPPALPSAIRDLPEHTGWANLRELGAKGDGITDDTVAIRKAISAHRTVFVPAGRYRVTDTIVLRPDTVLIGLHPSTTAIVLNDNTPAFQGPGSPKALLSSPQGGRTILTGVGLFTGGVNSRAVGALWQAGRDSLIDDVRFLGGHGTNNADGSRVNPYNANHTGDPDSRRRWDSQFPSLWVTGGGGGTFSNIWTPSTFADAGMYVSDTSTEGHVYELSSEHHVRMEVKLDHVANWELLALQTEEEHGEGPRALPLEIADSRNVLIANFHSYRVVGSHETHPCGVRVSNVTDVRFRNFHMDSDSKVSFDDALCDADSGGTVRFREFATLTLPASATSQTTAASAGALRKLAGGFYNISGPALDSEGRLYFVDPHEQKIYRWSSANRHLETICDAPLDAANLAVDHAGNLIIVSYAGNGTVYMLKPDAPLMALSLLAPVPASPQPGRTAILPVDFWKLRGDLLDSSHARRGFQYLSPDGTVFLPAGEDFIKGELYYGTKMSDVLRAFSLAPATAGGSFYVTDEEEEKTYVGKVALDGTVADLKLFAERGGEGSATDQAGNVYLAAGQIFRYSKDGKESGMLSVPERPTSLVVASTSRGEILYIFARTSLYAVDLARF